MQNIGAVNEGDAFYRYKMPKLQAKVEGRGNGIKTNVVNMVEIAKALARPPSYTTKYFGCELGAQSKYDEATETCIVNGNHSAQQLSETLEGFIKRFVCCYACGNPETVVGITKQENIELQCKACGNISKVDMRHKLCTFILKNPMEKTGGKKDKQLRRAEKERAEEGEAIDAEEKARRKLEKKAAKEAAIAEEEERKRKKKERKEEKKRREAEGLPPLSDDEDEKEKKEKKKNKKKDDDEDDVEWFTDTSSTAAAARAQEQLSNATSSMVTIGNIEAEEEERKEAEKAERKKYKKMVKGLRETIATSNSKQVAEDLAALELDGGLIARFGVLLDASMEDGEGPVAPQLAKKAGFLSVAAKGPEEQAALLAALEVLVGVSLPEKVKEVALVLKGFYDNDVVEEEAIFAWFDDKAAASEAGVDADVSAAVRKAAFPFVNWLKEADEGDSDEDSD